MEIKDEVLAWIFVHAIEEPSTRAFVQRLAEGEVYHNWKKLMFLLCSESNCSCLIMLNVPVLLVMWLITPQDFLC